MSTRELFNESAIEEHCRPSLEAISPADYQVLVAAHRLAVRFIEESDLPARYRRLANPSVKIRKVKEESDVEKQFKVNVDAWRELIEVLLSKVREDQAWRFVNACPQVSGDDKKVTECQDFCDFMDYMILRRDKEDCDSSELGGLALLLVAIQREVEKQIIARHGGVLQ